MQDVSQVWKENQKSPIVSESLIELLYEIGDPDSLADATPSDNGSETFSNTDIITNEIDEPMTRYATFERDLWKLDGSMTLLPEEAPYTGTGYVGDVICNNDGLFDVNPVITITFSQVYTKLIPGVTIRWGEVYQDYADTFKVTAYNGSTEVASVTVTNNTSTISQALTDIVDYDKIIIEIIKWGNPQRRARIEEVFVGLKQVYTKRDIINYKHSMSVDLLSAKLPKAEISFSISNLEGEYNPFNPLSQARYLIERQRIVVKYGYKLNGGVQWIKAGGFYLSDWVTPQNGVTASFTGRDLLEFMNNPYVGTISNITLYDLAISALTQANLPLNRDGSVKWVLDESLQSITVVSAELKEGITIAEILQLIANAGRCVMYQDRDEKLHIEPLSGGLTDYVINTANSYHNSEIKLSKKLKSVDVNKGTAVIVNDTEGEVQKVDNALIPIEQASDVGTWIKDTLKGRVTISGEFRADPRLDALDKITVANKYTDSTVIVTDIEYIYNGAFKGKYEGRVIE